MEEKMPITNQQSGTNVNEVAEGIYRISTPVEAIPGGFTFNQYLIAGDEALLFHTGGRGLFPLVREAVASVIPLDRLRYLALSHFEADECGSLNQWLAAAPNAAPLCGRIAALTSVRDFADRPPREMADGDTLLLGKHEVRWLDAPHMPHGWECGYLFEERTRTLFCGDLFTQPGARPAPLTEGDILGPSEALRSKLDYFSHARNSRALLEHLAATEPSALACMHGSAWRGDGAALLRELGAILDRA
jgi:flavorubredoxin